MLSASAGLSIELKYKDSSHFSVVGAGGGGKVLGVACGSATLSGAQGTLWDCRSSLIPCREGGLGSFGAIATSLIDLYLDVVEEGD